MHPLYPGLRFGDSQSGFARIARGPSGALDIPLGHPPSGQNGAFNMFFQTLYSVRLRESDKIETLSAPADRTLPNRLQLDDLWDVRAPGLSSSTTLGSSGDNVGETSDVSTTSASQSQKLLTLRPQGWLQ